MPVRARRAKKCAVGGSGDRHSFQAEGLERRLFLSSAIAAFGAAQTFAVGSSPFSVVTADVNIDGRPDLIVANSASNSVSMLLGNGNGTFQNQQTFAAGVKPYCVATADVNGDGKADLIVGNFSGPSSVLLGNGNGTFQNRMTFSVLPPVFITVADVNGDGKPDLITAYKAGQPYSSPVVTVLLGNGNGTFQNEPLLFAGPSPRSVAAADVNGDGKPDLIVANYNGSVSVLLGNGNGTFQSQATFAVVSESRSVATADVNGDGKLDLIVANQNSNCVSVLLGNGNGTFQNQLTFATGSAPISVVMADVNDDGKPDIEVANSTSGSVSVLLGNGNGTFQNQATFFAGAGPISIATTNVNGDGQPDIVVANSTSGTVSVLLGDVPPTVLSINRTSPPGPITSDNSVSFTVTFNESVTGVDLSDFSVVETGGVSTASLTVNLVSNSVYTVTVGGISGTGTIGLNLVDNGRIHDAAGNPLQPGGVAAFQNQQTFAAGVKPYCVATADVNGDGKADLIVGNFSGPSSVLLGNGNGTFQNRMTFSVLPPVFITVADVNGDGKPDLIAAYKAGQPYSSPVVTVLLGNGNGTFQNEPLLFAGPSPRSVAVADVNGDAKPDLIVANYNGSVSVLLGNGNGTFQSQATFAVVSESRSVATADVNGDGKLDLIVANENSNCVSVLLGNGNGTFQSQFTFATGSAPISVAMADVNDDSKPDIVVANFTSGNVSVLLGNGNGTFQNQATFSAGVGPISIATTDANGDGQPDILVANSTSGTVSVLLGNGNGSFQNQATFSAGADSISIAATDVNADGKLDLIVANQNSNTVSALLGNGNGNFTGQVYTIVPPADTITGTSGNDTITLTQNADATDIDWTFGASNGQLPISDPNGLTINGNGVAPGGSDTIVLNYGNSSKNPLPNTIHLNGIFTINGLQGSNPLANTTLEIGRSTVFISYSASDPLSLIQGYLRNGYNNGGWNGAPTASTGVITSVPAAQNAAQTTAIGYADSADGLISGQPTNTVELKYTVYGDTGLTTSVGFNDFTRLTQHYNQMSGGTWDTGDFNYDGSINSADFTLMTRTYNTTLGNQAAPAAIAAASAASATATSPTPSAPASKVAKPSPQVTPPTVTRSHHPERKHKKHR